MTPLEFSYIVNDVDATKSSL